MSLCHSQGWWQASDGFRSPDILTWWWCDHCCQLLCKLVTRVCMAPSHRRMRWATFIYLRSLKQNSTLEERPATVGRWDVFIRTMDATNNWSITCNKTWPRDKQGGKDTTIKQSGGTKVLLGMWLISISITSIDNLDNYAPLTAWIFKVSILRIHFQTICCQMSINNCFLDWISELVYVLNVSKHALL